MNNRLKNIFSFSTIWTILLVLALMIPFLLNIGADLNSQEGVNLTQREEVQRYFGYEGLLYRYLNLPYDLSINVNQRGEFVDIGFLFLIFIPIIIYLILGDSKKNKIIFGILFLLILSISIGNSFIYHPDDFTKHSDYASLNSFLDGSSSFKYPLTYILALVYLLFHSIFQGLDGILGGITGDHDYISYSILFLGFLGGMQILYASFKNTKGNIPWLVLILWIYSFFWLMLASGIIWYGYFMFAIAIMLMIKFFAKSKKKHLEIPKWLNYGFYGVVGVWLMICWVALSSQVANQPQDEHMGKAIMHPAVYMYNTGEYKDQNDILNGMYVGLPAALNEINSHPESKILRVGTSFTYFFSQNDTRVIFDNQLGLFSALQDRYPDQLTLNNVLKASNINYLIIDLNTPTLDNTPEQTLVNKYRNLLTYVFKNPDMRLLATDRVVSLKNQNGEESTMYQLFGNNIVTRGTYAIYELN